MQLNSSAFAKIQKNSKKFRRIYMNSDKFKELKKVMDNPFPRNSKRIQKNPKKILKNPAKSEESKDFGQLSCQKSGL